MIIVCGIGRCEHDPFLPAAECVATLVGSHNEEHYFVATQDVDMRKRLRKVCTITNRFLVSPLECTISILSSRGDYTHVLYDGGGLTCVLLMLGSWRSLDICKQHITCFGAPFRHAKTVRQDG